jgi:Protein of unknown function (DUF2911)
MKTNMHFLRLSLILTLVILSFAVKAQKQRQSPHDTVTAVVNGANLKVTFGSPAVKGRTIWGDLVPYDKAWRGGADEATLFTTDKEIKINGKKLAAGTYSLFVIPAKDKWTYIFNSQTGQWGIKMGGVANYDEAKNVLTVTADAKAVPMQEHLKYVFDGNMFGLNWAQLQALVKIE